jgi:hypothetical protein
MEEDGLTRVPAPSNAGRVNDWQTHLVATLMCDGARLHKASRRHSKRIRYRFGWRVGWQLTCGASFLASSCTAPFGKQIQALDRTQPGLPMKKGRAHTMMHDYLLPFQESSTSVHCKRLTESMKSFTICNYEKTGKGKGHLSARYGPATTLTAKSRGRVHSTRTAHPARPIGAANSSGYLSAPESRCRRVGRAAALPAST